MVNTQPAGQQGVKSIGFTDLDGMLLQNKGPKYGTFSAHPIIDPDTGEMFFFSKNGGPDSLPQIAYGYVDFKYSKKFPLHKCHDVLIIG